MSNLTKQELLDNLISSKEEQSNMIKRHLFLIRMYKSLMKDLKTAHIDIAILTFTGFAVGLFVGNLIGGFYG